MAGGKKGSRGSPAPHFAECISADHEDEFFVAKALAQSLKGIDQVGGTRAVHLNGVDAETGIALDGKFDPSQPLTRGCDDSLIALLVRGSRTGDEDHAGEFKSINHFFRGA